MQRNIGIVVNWHVTEACNYECSYCYSQWNRPKRPDLIKDSAGTSRLLREVYAIFSERHRRVRLNFAGGEPTLYGSRLISVMEEARALGFDVSLITNGSRVRSPEFLRMLPLLAVLGISVDSARTDTNRRIGRVDGRGIGSSTNDLKQAVAAARRTHAGIQIKVNTVVNELNWDEDLGELISTLDPDKWKVLRVLPVLHSRSAVIQEQFDSFVLRHSRLARLMCVEDNHDMQGSYVMIDPIGRFFQNSASIRGYTYSEEIIKVGGQRAFAQVDWSREKFVARYPVIPVRASR